MSNLQDHLAEQDAITTRCEAGPHTRRACGFKVETIIGANAYAVITDRGARTGIRLAPGVGVGKALQFYADSQTAAIAKLEAKRDTALKAVFWLENRAAIEAFVYAYTSAAVWLGIPQSNDLVLVEDLAPEAKAQMTSDCVDICWEYWPQIQSDATPLAAADPDMTKAERKAMFAGPAFACARRDSPVQLQCNPELAEAVREVADCFGPFDLVRLDDGKVHIDTDRIYL